MVEQQSAAKVCARRKLMETLHRLRLSGGPFGAEYAMLREAIEEARSTHVSDKQLILVAEKVLAKKEDDWAPNRWVARLDKEDDQPTRPQPSLVPQEPGKDSAAPGSAPSPSPPMPPSRYETVAVPAIGAPVKGQLTPPNLLGGLLPVATTGQALTRRQVFEYPTVPLTVRRGASSATPNWRSSI